MQSYTLADLAGTRKTSIVPVPRVRDGDVHATDTSTGTGTGLPESGPLLAPGHVICQSKSFEIISPLGEGGMGCVYKAYDASMDRYLALKVLKTDVPESERLRFHQEALIASNFSHPHLVRVLEVGQSGEDQWMAMEYLRGKDLAALLAREPRFPFDLMAEVVEQALSALGYIHARGIVHCDVKPENIFVSRDVFDRRIVLTKLIDFGIATHVRDQDTRQNYVVGDPRYMAPERTVPDRPYDGRTDLYALAMTAYEAWTGQHPLDPEQNCDVRELLRRQREQPCSPPGRLLPASTPRAIRDALDAFLGTACQKDPDARFPDAHSMSVALAQLRALVHAHRDRDEGLGSVARTG